MAINVIHSASAHTLKSQGSIGVVVHVDPNDEPIATQAATVFVDLQDKSSKLSPQNCDCKLVITSSTNDELLNTQLFKAGSEALSAATPVTFPQAGVYSVTVTGAPHDEGEFEKFAFSYDLRVDPAPKERSATGVEAHLGHYILFGIAGIFLLGYLWYAIKRKSKSIH